MKRFLSLALFVIIILAACFLLSRHKLQPNPTSKVLDLEQPPSENLKTNTAKTPVITQVNNSQKILNATTTQNIEQWKAAITNLRSDPTLKGNWTMWQSYTNAGFPLSVSNTNGALVEFNSNLINIYTRRDNSGNLRRVEMHSVWMNIADTRTLGDLLLQLMGKDESSFNAWCDKVGNHWIDAPLYDSGNARLPNSNKFYAFGVHITFNNEKPWYILLVITDP